MSSIRIEETRAYKSISGIGSATLPYFAVLAGVNGAGKSHLLQAMKEGAIRVYRDGTLIDTQDIALYDWSDFAVRTPAQASSWQIGRRRDQLVTAIRHQMASGRAGQRVKSHHERTQRHFTESELLRTPINELRLPEHTAKAVDEERRAIRNELVSAIGSPHNELIELIESLTGKLIV